MLTGAPGAGKTTLLAALAARGFSTVADSARSVIQDRRRRGLSARPDALEFAHEVLRIDAQNHERHASTNGPVFFDRGVVDALGMLDEASPLGARALAQSLAKYRYSPAVFLLPPWRAIYVTDSERDQTFDEAKAVDRNVRAWYRRCGYDPIELSEGSVAERCAQVLASIAASGARPAIRRCEP